MKLFASHSFDESDNVSGISGKDSFQVREKDGGCLALQDLAFNTDRGATELSIYACAFSNYRIVRRGLNCLANIDLSLNYCLLLHYKFNKCDDSSPLPVKAKHATIGLSLCVMSCPWS